MFAWKLRKRNSIVSSTAYRTRVTAVVPTWREAAEIERSLRSLREGGVDEIVVVDGGSDDGTIELARRHADRVLECAGGLFAQLNHGARAASGDVLVFHYADVQFPERGHEAIDRALEEERVVGGAFALLFASASSRYHVIARAANLRNRLRLGPFGDQSIFVRTAAFEKVGGFRPDRFLEDLQLVERLRRLGRFRLLDEQVRASVRRWECMGTLRTLVSHWWLCVLYLAGKRRAGSRAARRAVELRTLR